MATLPAETRGNRIVTLDVVRGIAVMGIFSVNVVGMAMLQFAYFYPPAYGFDGFGDHLMWFLNFVLVDGKLRSLFSILFGASMLLVAEQAVKAARSPWRTHYARMIVLLVIGWLHWALLWWGDILTHYAAVGMAAFLMWKLRAKWLMVIAAVLFVIHAAPPVYFFTKEIPEYYEVKRGDASPEVTKKWKERIEELTPSAERLAKDRAEHRNIATRFNAAMPDFSKPISGGKVMEVLHPLDLGPLWLETIALMLLGMAGYKSGFLTGTWQNSSYRRVAVFGLGVGLAVYGFLGARAWLAGFAPVEMFTATQIATPIFRPIMASGYAALIILLFRNASALRARFAAVGRMAFSNYLLCTFIGTFIFYGMGLDLYGKLSRGEAWLLVPPVWALMLLWSKPWLDRFHYGPMEWAWRSLARGKLQPMRKRPAGEPLPAAA
ncbi:MAG TPA: DUF418 domain-containing protein [Sphingomicrobium sp.]|nr:DUF418 domain-containing protein [Sphingomicrobium sp.]